MRQSSVAGLALAVTSSVAFGLSGPFGKALIDSGWSSNGTLLVRLGSAAAVLTVLLVAVRPGTIAAIRSDAPAVVLYGALGMAGAQGCFFNAVRYLPVPIALLLEYNGPILVIGWVWLVRRRPPTRRTLVGGLVALLGLTMVVQVWTGGGLAGPGIAWGLAAAVCQSAYFLVADRAEASTPPLVLAGVGMIVATVLAALSGALGVLPVVVTEPTGGVALAGTHVDWRYAAAFLVLVPTVLAYLTGIAAVSRIGATRAALVGLLEVVSAALASWLLLGEVPGPLQAVGGALILAGVALTQNAGAAAGAAARAGRGVS